MTSKPLAWVTLTAAALQWRLSDAGGAVGWHSAGPYGMPFPGTFPGLTAGMCVVFLCYCCCLETTIFHSCFSSASHIGSWWLSSALCDVMFSNLLIKSWLLSSSNEFHPSIYAKSHQYSISVHMKKMIVNKENTYISVYAAGDEHFICV